MIRLLVTASRTWVDANYIYRVLDDLLNTHGSVALWHGACPEGGDNIADRWAMDWQTQGAAVVVHRHPAQWQRFGRSAGPRRNAEMVAAIGTGGNVQCHAFIRDGSSGASGCAELARLAGIPVTEHEYEAVISGV